MTRRARLALARPAGAVAPPGPPPEKLATVAEAASFLRVSRDWIYAHADTKDLPHYRVGKFLRFDLAALAAWVAAHRGE